MSSWTYSVWSHKCPLQRKALSTTPAISVLLSRTHALWSPPLGIRLTAEAAESLPCLTPPPVQKRWRLSLTRASCCELSHNASCALLLLFFSLWAPGIELEKQHDKTDGKNHLYDDQQDRTRVGLMSRSHGKEGQINTVCMEQSSKSIVN